MPDWSVCTLLVFTIGWLGISILLSVLSWRSYRDELRDWTPKTCDVEATVVACQDRDFRVDRTISFKGKSDLVTIGLCEFTEAEAEEEQEDVDDTVRCYIPPDGEDRISLFSHPSDEKKRRLLFSLVMPMLACISGTAMLVLVLFRVFAIGPRAFRNGAATGLFGSSSSGTDTAFYGLSGVIIRRPDLAHNQSSRRLSALEADRAVREMLVDVRPDADKDRGHPAESAEMRPPTTISPDEVCVVCLDDMSALAPVRAAISSDDDSPNPGQIPSARKAVLLPCRHAYHRECIRGWWVKGQAVCPCCNLDVASIIRGGGNEGERVVEDESLANVDSRSTVEEDDISSSRNESASERVEHVAARQSVQLEGYGTLAENHVVEGAERGRPVESVPTPRTTVVPASGESGPAAVSEENPSPHVSQAQVGDTVIVV